MSLRKWFSQPSDWRPFFNHTRTLRPMTMILIWKSCKSPSAKLGASGNKGTPLLQRSPLYESGMLALISRATAAVAAQFI